MITTTFKIQEKSNTYLSKTVTTFDYFSEKDIDKKVKFRNNVYRIVKISVYEDSNNQYIKLKRV